MPTENKPYELSSELKWEITYDRQLFIASMERVLRQLVIEKSVISMRKLAIVMYLGEYQELSFDVIKKRYDISDRALWQDIDDLLQIGYIKKVSDSDNARRKLVLITERGLEVIKEWSKVALPGYNNYD